MPNAKGRVPTLDDIRALIAAVPDDPEDLPPASDHDPFQPATRFNLARTAFRLDVLCSELELGMLESRVADLAAGANQGWRHA